MDLGAVAHLSAIKARIPFLQFFDGFRTSHEIQKIDIWDYKDLAPLVDYDAVKKFKNTSLNPERPKTMGTAQKLSLIHICNSPSTSLNFTSC